MKEREEIEREKSEKEKRNENTKTEKQKPATLRGETKAETPLNKRMHSRSAGGRDERIKEATNTRGKDENRERKKPQENESSAEEEVSKVRKKEREEAEERGMPNQTSEEENDSPMDSEDMSKTEKYERLSAAYHLSLFPTNPNEQRKK